MSNALTVQNYAVSTVYAIDGRQRFDLILTLFASADSQPADNSTPFTIPAEVSTCVDAVYIVVSSGSNAVEKDIAQDGIDAAGLKHLQIKLQPIGTLRNMVFQIEIKSLGIVFK